MNEQNLKPFGTLTEKEQRELAKKGGKASVEARRRKKTLREELILLLETNDTQHKVSAAMINEALNGNVKAFTAIRDTIGEKPVEKVVVAEVEQSVIDEVEKAVFEDDDETTGN